MVFDYIAYISGQRNIDRTSSRNETVSSSRIGSLDSP